MNVRRLAAIDMYGGAGRPWRRRVILAEFLLGFVALVTVGILLMLNNELGFWWFAGAWFIGVGINYLPISLHAIDLSRPGVLSAELDGVDTRAEIKYYSVHQMWLLLPLTVALMAMRQWLTGQRPAGV